MKNFALIGIGGYVAPKHLKAIKETGNDLLTAYDKFDSVGVIDSYFPKVDFFTEYERFDRHIEKLKREQNTTIDYVSICTPNYLHDSHIRMALRMGANAICEKPLVLNPWNLDKLAEIEMEYNRKINTILQLRLHPSIIALKNEIDAAPKDKVFDVDLTYITSRGKWYYTSWKGDLNKSGGIATNIGIHFFDMLSWIFGKNTLNKVHLHEHDRASGYIEYEKARVRWFLSINSDTLPKHVLAKGQKTYRCITVNGKEIEFSEGFKDLHTKSYQNIIESNGFTLEDSRSSIAQVHEIRTAKMSPIMGDYHPLSKFPLAKHPFNR